MIQSYVVQPAAKHALKMIFDQLRAEPAAMRQITSCLRTAPSIGRTNSVLTIPQDNNRWAN